MSKKILPTPEELRQLLRYEPETGKLYWKERPASMFKTSDRRGPEWAANMWNARYAGKEAFTARETQGYLCGGINRKVYKAHRVAWAIHHGSWPSEFIDHINMLRDDNRLENLREATRSENSMNRGRQVNSTSGHKGVYWHKTSKKWMARARLHGKSYYLGFFDEKQDAIDAYRRHIHQIHGDYAREG